MQHSNRFDLELLRLKRAKLTGRKLSRMETLLANLDAIVPSLRNITLHNRNQIISAGVRWHDYFFTKYGDALVAEIENGMDYQREIAISEWPIERIKKCPQLVDGLTSSSSLVLFYGIDEEKFDLYGELLARKISADSHSSAYVWKGHMANDELARRVSTHEDILLEGIVGNIKGIAESSFCTDHPLYANFARKVDSVHDINLGTFLSMREKEETGEDARVSFMWGTIVEVGQKDDEDIVLNTNILWNRQHWWRFGIATDMSLFSQLSPEQFAEIATIYNHEGSREYDSFLHGLRMSLQAGNVDAWLEERYGMTPKNLRRYLELERNGRVLSYAVPMRGFLRISDADFERLEGLGLPESSGRDGARSLSDEITELSQLYAQA